MSVLFRGARVLTMDGSGRAGLRRGRGMSALGQIPCADVLVRNGVVGAVASAGCVQAPADAEVIEAEGRVLMPGFVDCHTHACWAGERLGEWQDKLRGATYLEILERGGGIMSTVRAVRVATEEDLRRSLLDRLGVMLREGTTTVEVKSGYGLSTADELKMLRAIRSSAAAWPGAVAPTALLGHAIDPDTPDFVDRTIGETLDAVHAEFPGTAVDVFCERGAWSLEDATRLLERAVSLGLPVRAHLDQFNRLGLLRWVIDRGPGVVRSVDHLEASSPEDLRLLGASGVPGVLLPCSGFHTDGRYADGRAIIDAGGAVAIATNCNPGSAPTSSMPMAMALAARFCGLSPEEAIVAATTNGAAVLGLTDRGVIAPGARADLVLLRHRDERMLAFEFGGDPVDVVVCAGRIVRRERGA